MKTNQQTGRIALVIVAATLVAGLGAMPAAARPDAGTPLAPPSSSTSFCPIQRVGHQYVACDNLTGNGVPAPGWIDEQ